MISIRESIDEFEKLYQLRSSALEGYTAALRNIAQYAIELDDGSTNTFKSSVTALAEQVAGGEAAVVNESKSTLRGILRNYRERAAQYLGGLHTDFASTARALEEIMETLSQTDLDHEAKLRVSIQSLRDACQSVKTESLRDVVLGATEAIERGLDQLSRQHQVTVAQFRMEIRVLHKRIDSLETTASIDGMMSAMLTRRDVEERLAAKGGGSLLLIRVSGLRLAETTFEPAVVATLSAAFVRRLRNTLPPGAEIARWSREEFIALVGTGKEEALPIAKWIAEHLSGPYSCVADTRTVHPALQLSVGLIERNGESATQTLARIADFLHGEDQAATSAKAGPRR